MRKLPNFLIIGAAKSGTTSLYHYLNEHPQIYMSNIQEPKFFSFINQDRLDLQGIGDKAANTHIVRHLEDYYPLFFGHSTEIAIGESSPCYLYYEHTAQNIHQILPDAKIIIILRNPAERAYSNFLHLVSSGRERLYDFGQALDAENDRIQNGWEYFWHYKNQGFYYQKLQPYLTRFDRNNIKIVLYEDYEIQNNVVLAEIFAFLGVDQTFVSNLDNRYNVTHFPVSKLLNQFLSQSFPMKSIVKKLIPTPLRHFALNQIHSLNSTQKKPPFKTDLRKKLIDEYSEDILNLQDLLQRDLSSWLTTE